MLKEDISGSVWGGGRIRGQVAGCKRVNSSVNGRHLWFSVGGGGLEVGLTVFVNSSVNRRHLLGMHPDGGG